jgi:hypothetical protein
MSDTPIHTFLSRMNSFHPHDVAVLFSLFAMQEVAEEMGGSMAPASAARRIWSVDLETNDIRESLARLMEAGEVEFQDGGGTTDSPCGYRVTRFQELLDLMTDFGRRRYNRIKQQECKSRKEDQLA